MFRGPDQEAILICFIVRGVSISCSFSMPAKGGDCTLAPIPEEETLTSEKTLRQSFAEEHPDVPLLSLDDPQGVQQALRSLGWLSPSESVVLLEKPGEGNMNLTLRVGTGERTVIVKQSRPWVEKYDFIEAPFDRVLSEVRFYERVEELQSVAEAMPRIQGADTAWRMLLLEDLGDGADLSRLYGSDADDPAALTVEEGRFLGRFLADLHGGTRSREPRYENAAMRELNAAHIFDVPMQEDNGVDLESFEPGLAEAANSLRQDAALKQTLQELATRYLAFDGPCLVHGDFFPGSWLRTARGLYVIDPEFAFCGAPEFDVAVAVAHLAMASQSRDAAAALADAAGGSQLRSDWVAQFAGAEAIRRILGVAQLPLPPSTGRRARVLEAARHAVVSSALEPMMDLCEAPAP